MLSRYPFQLRRICHHHGLLNDDDIHDLGAAHWHSANANADVNDHEHEYAFDKHDTSVNTFVGDCDTVLVDLNAFGFEHTYSLIDDYHFDSTHPELTASILNYLTKTQHNLILSVLEYNWHTSLHIPIVFP
ncbi:hypothetical protein NKR23_g7249 [Pleurostoma richardsiae]|uniref:Uncharacterized protein n=1 Tax=Pleurostoma richardsiae TaxID=41990 RepID=A0AA38VN10_9PEZI|nr:hypothetical protein NKR23_g7249 [Pleurostoma richardsiae]